MKKALFLFLTFSTALWAQKPIFTTAKTKSATVYFNGAEISQNTSVNLPTGTSEIVIKNVADFLNENTVKIGSPNSVTILSVQFTQNYISEYEIDETNPIIKKVRDSISWTEKEIKKTQIQTASNEKGIELLNQNQIIGGATSGMSVIELTKLLDYQKTKRIELDYTIVSLKEKENQLKEKLKTLNSKLEINAQKEDKSSKGKLILQVMNEIAGLVNLDINYITSGASWTPFYDLRADNISSPINMMYKGQIKQNTGIDWKKIKLTLSSGNPIQNNQSPTINPWFLNYEKDIASKTTEGRPNATFIQSLQGSVAGLNVTTGTGQPSSSDKVILRGVGTLTGKTEPLYVIDGIPMASEAFRNLPPESIKSVSVLKDAGATSIYGSRAANGVVVVKTKGMNDYTNINETQLNISFDIDIPYDILSNGKPHSVALKELKLPATYSFFAVPKLEKEAFLLAEIKDYSKYNLLPGDANIVFEGLYVGKTKINPNQTSDTLNLSMGRDKKISIKREKIVEKSGTKFLSSKKEQIFTYDIIVRNNKKENAQIELKDQYPLSTDKEIEIALTESSNAKVDKETGILTWNINLTPNETKKVRISYNLKYPKDKIIENL